AVELAKTVKRRATQNWGTETRDVREAQRVVRIDENRFAEVATDFVRVDIERAHELDVADGVTTEHVVHQARDRFVPSRIFVERHSLHEGRRTVSGTNDRNADLRHSSYPLRRLPLSPAAAAFS